MQATIATGYFGGIAPEMTSKQETNQKENRHIEKVYLIK